MKGVAMDRQYCPACGHPNPGEARYCLECGQALEGAVTDRASWSYREADRGAAAHEVPSQQRGTDWASIVAAIVAFFSLRHMSRKARQTTIVVAFLVLFFGCPLMCGFVAFVLEWIGQLVR